MNRIDALEEKLRRKIGLDVESIGRNTLHQIVKRQAGDGGLEDYLNKVLHTATELEALIEAIVVSETWFYRDPGAFQYLGEFAKSLNTIHVLCAPCATGEEAYSCAMALEAAGIQSFHIEGWDISAEALRRANIGCYGRNSFRTAFADQEEFFTPVPGSLEQQIRPRIRDHIHFEQVNLLERTHRFSTPKFEAIFCRNLLIYLDAVGRKIVFENLRALLLPGGVLFTGPSEQLLAREVGLESIGKAGTYAFCEPTKLKTATQILTLPKKAKPRFAPPKPRLIPTPQAIPVPRCPPESSLEEAKRLADLGRVQEAMAVCSELERVNAPSCELLYLMGLMLDSNGDDRSAADYYRKALYLEPAHREAMAHLALVKERMGDREGAERLRGRLKRMETKA